MQYRIKTNELDYLIEGCCKQFVFALGNRKILELSDTLRSKRADPGRVRVCTMNYIGELTPIEYCPYCGSKIQIQLDI